MPNEEQNFLPIVDYINFRKCSPSWRWYGHILPPADITYLIQGSARYTINGVVYNAAAGDMICLPPGSERSAFTFPANLMHCFSINFWLYSIGIGKNGGGRLELETIQLPFPIFSHIGIRKELVQLFDELVSVWRNKQPGYVMKVNGIFLLILNRLFELTVYDIDSTAGDFRVTRTKRYIAMNYDKDIPIKKLADMVGLNAVYLDSLFKKETGATLHQYQIKVRIKNAENMLRSGKYKVSTVAEHCGYSDVLHFSRQFKSVMGFPPSKCIPR